MVRTHAGEGGVPHALERIQAPALIVHGAEDRVIHPDTARDVAGSLPNARLELMSGVGHVPHMEAPRAVARLIDAFMDAGGR
jgi:magnesium chelatase accessory protein